MKDAYTVKEIAYMENVSVKTVYRWCREGYLVYFRRRGKRGRLFITKNNYIFFKKTFYVCR